jgi:hypothetical protein
MAEVVGVVALSLRVSIVMANPRDGVSKRKNKASPMPIASAHSTRRLLQPVSARCSIDEQQQLHCSQTTRAPAADSTLKHRLRCARACRACTPHQPGALAWFWLYGSRARFNGLQTGRDIAPTIAHSNM